MTFSTEQNISIAGVILAGGLATRMGGGDKTQKVIGNRKILNIVIERISHQVSGLALNTNNDPSHYCELGLPLLSDAFEERYGPLAGILAGMDWAHHEGFGLVVTVAGDTPFFPDDLVFRLLTHQLDSNARIILAATRDQETDKLYRHPTFGLWSVDLRHDLRENLKRGVRKIVQWTDQHNAEFVEFQTGKMDPFFNINTPGDLVEAEKLMRYCK